MKLDVEYVSGIAIVIVKEGLTGDESDDLVPAVQQIIDEGTRKFIVDLSESGKIDSMGIGNLVKAYTIVAKLRGRLVLVLPSNFFRSDLLGIPQLISIFEFYQSREEAIEALLEPTPDASELEPGPRPKLEVPQPQNSKSSTCLILSLGVIVLSILMSLAVWLATALYHFFT